jgi:hypothetical protein
MQLVDDNGNVFGGPFLEITGPDGKPKTISSGTPIGPAGGDLSGTYPNPSVVWNNGIPTYNSLYFPIPTGTTVQYIRGDGSLATFPAIPAQYNPTAGTGISITGAYPNQTITNTLTLTTTGTSGAATLVGDTLNIPEYSGGGGGLKGIHAILPLSSSDSITNSINGTNLNGTVIGNRLTASPFIPAQNITSSSLYVSCSGAVVGALGRILIYSDLNGKPNSKLYESADLNLSTTGIKTAVTTFNFIAGEIYWLCYHSNSLTPIMSQLANSNGVLIKSSAGICFNMMFQNIALGTAPATWTATSYNSFNIPLVGITKA